MNNFCDTEGQFVNKCSYLKDKNQRIHELEEKIREYKAKVRDLYQVDISDLKETIRCLKERIEELECENESLNEDELVKRVEELEDDNEKLKDLRDHLTRLGIKKESEIVNLKEENEKLLNEIKCWKDKYETLDKDSTDGSYIYISIPKGQKISNFEVYFQEEKATSITFPSSPINPVITPTVTYASGKGPTITRQDQFGEWHLKSNGSSTGGGDAG